MQIKYQTQNQIAFEQNVARYHFTEIVTERTHF